MDKNGDFLENLPPEAFKLTLINAPFIQKQHRDYWSIDNMTINEYDLIICISGAAEFSIENRKFILSEGMGFLVPPGIAFSAKHIGDDYFIAIAQHFELKIFGELNFFELFNYKEVHNFSNWEFVKSILERFEKLVTSRSKKIEQQTLFNIVINEYIYDAFMEAKIQRGNDFAFIFEMLNIINTNLRDKDVMLKALKASPYTRDYTSRKFKKIIGDAPKQYIIKARINLGGSLLQGDGTIKEIAYQCGFEDELYFSKMFKKHMTISPGIYRKQNYKYGK